MLTEVTTTLLTWLSLNSQYDVSQMLRPRVVPLTAQALTAEYYSDYPDRLPEDGVDERVKALYDGVSEPAGIVYVLEPAVPGDYDDPLFQERLLHELVHHAQRHSGRVANWRCRAHGEREAYRLGGEFLRQRHVEDPMPNRRFWAAIYSRC